MSIRNIVVDYGVTTDDAYARAVNMYQGKLGLATDAELHDWFKEYGFSKNDDPEFSKFITHSPVDTLRVAYTMASNWSVKKLDKEDDPETYMYFMILLHGIGEFLVSSKKEDE